MSVAVSMNQSLEIQSKNNKLGPYGVFTPNKQNSSEWNFRTGGNQSPRGVDDSTILKAKRAKKGQKGPVSNIKDIMNIYSDVKQQKWCNEKLPTRYVTPGPQQQALLKTQESANH